MKKLTLRFEEGMMPFGEVQSAIQQLLQQGVMVNINSDLRGIAIHIRDNLNLKKCVRYSHGYGLNIFEFTQIDT